MKTVKDLREFLKGKRSKEQVYIWGNSDDNGKGNIDIKGDRFWAED